ncbi:hypothetical protein ACUY3K_06845 [Corynebacterium uberis]|uniref:hypothetical protein n=1 Tax=Corynebacterium TaxID=1716 RepID=UPI001D0A058E|nr:MULTISPECIES: hypothetical protein [Corynebacterium]MCZ9308836.1 hypothetical protein [Corynebacterium sp. c6VSa_13]UDL72638.1 hypothetical protein LH391_05740 [Corynebacterium uberis]UDL76486.1 hypothetical protein LH393_03665 [Corynebacterium uberis]UDL78698.1 hypothetical protein LH394_03650 [Corynebacterium uberis]UDL80977.1 hypothetical protein LH392_04075 [Corynebacterium uberis]
MARRYVVYEEEDYSGCGIFLVIAVGLWLLTLLAPLLVTLAKIAAAGGAIWLSAKAVAAWLKKYHEKEDLERDRHLLEQETVLVEQEIRGRLATAVTRLDSLLGHWHQLCEVQGIGSGAEKLISRYHDAANSTEALDFLRYTEERAYAELRNSRNLLDCAPSPGNARALSAAYSALTRAEEDFYIAVSWANVED